eukprot:12801082-Alexandrium_andersonii.AAC.1
MFGPLSAQTKHSVADGRCVLRQGLVKQYVDAFRRLSKVAREQLGAPAWQMALFADNVRGRRL